MFPGISIPAEGLPSFAEGEPWSVKVPGNPAPIAVCLFNFNCCVSNPSWVVIKLDKLKSSLSLNFDIFAGWDHNYE